MRIVLATTAVLCTLVSNAEAHSRYHHHHRGHSGRHAHYAGHSSGRPGAWCGWYMRSQVGSDPGPSYNLARSWASYGSNAGGPQVGAIVVWRPHVGKIVGQETAAGAGRAGKCAQ